MGVIGRTTSLAGTTATTGATTGSLLSGSSLVGGVTGSSVTESCSHLPLAHAVLVCADKVLIARTSFAASRSSASVVSGASWLGRCYGLDITLGGARDRLVDRLYGTLGLSVLILDIVTCMVGSELAKLCWAEFCRSGQLEWSFIPRRSNRFYDALLAECKLI